MLLCFRSAPLVRCCEKNTATSQDHSDSLMDTYPLHSRFPLLCKFNVVESRSAHHIHIRTLNTSAQHLH
ncbi:hypothetical protein E2C01_027217 [Portunus trituberculatus]|uniref:Uncharacterized protein n=1 Tax=Portunus trituberculatus TaxID=210409 RepID=A0A5B7EHC0_PORTR|nr:hypothetical protein [Portunus trituberculatus]